MATEVMTAPEGRIIHKTYAVLSGAAIPQRVYVTQYDESLPVIACTLYKDGQLYTIPDGASVRLRMNKNGLPVYHEAMGIDDARHVVYLEITAQMTVLYGEFAMVLEVETSDGKTAGTSYLRLIVRQNPVQNPELDNIPDYTANSNRLTAEGVKKLQDESSTQQKAIEDKGKNTLESIPADYSALSGKVDKNTSGISELKEDISNLGYFKRVSYTGVVWKGEETVESGVPLYFRPVVVPEGKTYLELFGIYGADQKDGYDTLATLKKGEIKKIIPSRDYHHLQVAFTQYVPGESFTFVFDYLQTDLDGIQTDLEGIQTDLEGIRPNSAKTASRIHGMKVNLDTTAFTFNIEDAGDGLIFTKNRYYKPTNNSDLTLTLDYTPYVDTTGGSTVALIFNSTLKDYCLKTVNSGFHKFDETDVVLMLVYFKNDMTLSNVGAIPFCNNLFVNGEELPSIYSLTDSISANETAIQAVQNAVASGHFSTTQSTTILDYKGISAGETYKIYAWNVTGFYHNSPSCYLFYQDDTWVSYFDTREIINGTVIYTVTIPENAKYLRLYCDKQVGADTASCDWAYVRVSGARLDVIEKKIQNIQENTLSVVSQLNNRTCNIFQKVVCCGDSYTSGHMSDASGVATPTNEKYAWPHFMGKLTGSNWVNCGCSGCNVLTWQTHARGLPAAQTAGKAQAYVIGLMINDVSNSDRAVELGTADDIGTDAQTYYGGMSAIIRKLNEISPNAKIFVNTCPKTGEKYTTYNQAVRDIVNAYKETYPVHCIDLEARKDLYNNSSLTADAWYGHYTAIGYEQFAEIYAYILSQYINEHVSDFQNVYQIEYDV